jgi:hypothetical protein
MTGIKSKAEFFRRAERQKVRARIVGGWCRDDWQDQVKHLKAQCRTQGLPDSAITVTDDLFTVQVTAGRESYVQRPKMKRERIGTLCQQSARYTFTEDGTGRQSGGEKKALQLEGDTLFLTTVYGTKIVYSLVEEQE